MNESGFVNEQVYSDGFPDLLRLKHENLSEKYAQINLLVHAIVISIIVLILCVIRFQPFFQLPDLLETFLNYFIAFVAIVLGLLIGFYSYVADKRKTYALREQDLSFSSGLIFRKTITQPILRIQHIELKRGPVERKVGLATLQVFSAGGVSHTFEIPGLPHKRAGQLRQFILGTDFSQDENQDD
jgi:uncharacterized protein